MLKEFKAFINRGNVLDLAVAVMIGAAFGRITGSLTEDIIMPVVGALFGDLDFSNYFLRLGPVPEGYEGSLVNYAELKQAGVVLLGWGQFLSVFVNFLLLALILFLIVRAANRAMDALAEEKPEVAAEEPTEVVLLREIRDELRNSGRDPASTSH
ncbi:MAG: large conductance mechanosensitive channel protein MscL [Sphingomonadaceae bacterium]